MNNFLIPLLFLFAIVNSLPTTPKDLKGQALVDYINSQGKWKAKLQLEFANFTKMQGARLGLKTKYLLKSGKYENTSNDIPEEFDARKNWPKCADIIGNIADQSECGSCYAVSATSVISDRLCIASGGKIKTFVSATDALTCCKSCGFGCTGGWPDLVLEYWADNGVVSGSNYTTDEGCRPYSFAPCQHYGFYYENSKFPKCPNSYYDTPLCVKKCNPSYNTEYENDKTYGQKTVVYLEDVGSIQKEIMTNGPVVAVYAVYEDFKMYSSDIYEQVSTELVGYHAVKIIGWGKENGIEWWKVQNSWNSGKLI